MTKFAREEEEKRSREWSWCVMSCRKGEKVNSYISTIMSIGF